MADLNLIDRNPFTDAYRAGQQFGTEQRTRDFELQEAQRVADEATALDEALRQEALRVQEANRPAPLPQMPAAAPQPAMPQGAASPGAITAQPAQPAQQQRVTADWAGAAASVPGGGAMAAGMMQQDEARREQMQSNALTSLVAYSKSGNPVDLQTYRMMAQQSGLALPPGIEEDAAKSGLVARGMLVMAALYKEDPQQGQVFLRNWLQSQGDLEKSVMATGAPRNSRKSITILNAEGKRQLAMIDSVTGEVTPATTGGAPVMMPAPASATSEPVQVKLVQFLMDKGIAASFDEAWAMITQAKQSPEKIYQQVYSKIYAAQMRNFVEHEEASAQAHAGAMDVAARLQAMYGPGGSMMGGESAPAQPAPAPAPAPPEQPGIFQRGYDHFFGGGQQPAAPQQAPAPQQPAPGPGRQPVWPGMPWEPQSAPAPQAAPAPAPQAAPQPAPQTQVDPSARLAPQAQQPAQPTAVRTAVDQSLQQQPAAPAQPAPAPQQYTEGQTATHPMTGQKIIYQGGQWLPLQ